MSLKAELANRLVKDMLMKARGNQEGTTVMVMDPHASRILSSCCRMYDIMETGVVVVQNLLLARERLDLPAIYFLSPTESSIRHLLEDFKIAKKPKYPAVHLFFTRRVSDECMQLISHSPALISRIKNFIEMNVDFLSAESRVFLFDRSMAIPRLYFPITRDIVKEELLESARQLVTFCLTMKQFPAIRYLDNGKNDLCKNLALIFENEMKEAVRRLPEWKYNLNGEGGILMIVDRSVDPISPLMHEYTYQAMCTDLLVVHGELAYTSTGAPTPLTSSTNTTTITPTSSHRSRNERKSMGDEEEMNENERLPPAGEITKIVAETPPIVLSEDDSLWIDFRHKHIAQVMQMITQKFKEFKGTNKIAGINWEDKSVTVRDMIRAMRDLPEYKDLIQRYAKHMNLAEQCMIKYEEKRLREIGELEQSMATSIDEHSRPIDDTKLKANLVRLCQDPNIGVLERMRLIMIYIASRGGLQEATRRELLRQVDESLQQAIRRLEALGIDLSWSAKPRPIDKKRVEEFKKRNQSIQYQLMRFIPALETIMEGLIKDDLSESQFPWLSRPARSSSSAAATAGGRSVRARTAFRYSDESSSSSSSTDSPVRNIIFMIGGITQSEVRATYEVSDKLRTSLVIGSTHVLSPREYIRELSGLSKMEFVRALRASASALASASAPEAGRGLDSKSHGFYDVVDEDVGPDEQLEPLSLGDVRSDHMPVFATRAA